MRETKPGHYSLSSNYQPGERSIIINLFLIKFQVSDFAGRFLLILKAIHHMKYTVQDGFPYYIELTGEKDYRQLFLSQENLDLLQSITEEKSAFRYAPGKWSIKQIIGHITDHERIMLYRALRFSRNDKTSLPGYDQDVLVNGSRFDELPVAQLVEDLRNVRNASVSFIGSLSGEQLQRTGIAWKYELTVEEFLKATIGHELHHIAVLKDKYGIPG